MRLRIAHGLHALKSSEGDGLDIIAYAVVTLAFAHAALFLDRRAYAWTEQCSRYLIFSALVIGYLSAFRGLFRL